MDLLQQDLRRNNDDYIDKFKKSKPVEPVLNKQSGSGNVAKTNVKKQVSDNINSLNKPNQMYHDKDANRRNLDFSDEVNYNKYSFSPGTLASKPQVAVPTINPKRFHKVTMSTAVPDPNAPLESISSNDNYPKYLEQAKIQKFKQFMDKNKGLIQDFIKNKREGAQTTEPMPTLAASIEDGNNRARSSEERRQAVPGPRQLDMAPAKGGRIHSMRLKVRPCRFCLQLKRR